MAKSKKKRRIQGVDPARAHQALQEIEQMSFQSAAIVEDAYRSCFSVCLSSLRFLAPRLVRIRALKADLRQRILGES
ncbi:MAG: hypothetical protein H7837_11310 [Magnetococcus sp. MYC-9]